jgi:SSS family solute:Na+ symporter
MHPLDWTIVLLLNGAVIVYGLYLARGTHTSSEWFLGARVLPWWAVGLSMFATNVDNADLTMVTGKTYNEGLHILSVYAVGSAVGGIVAAFMVVPTMYRAGFYTNAEFLEARYGPAMRVLSAVIQIQYRSSMLGMMIWSVHVLLTGLEIMGPVEAWVLILALVILAGMYTAWGGLRSVVWTDAVQGLVMMAGAVVVFGVVWQAVGGWEGMESSLARIGRSDLLHIGRFHGASGDVSPYLVMFGWTVIGCGYWTVNHTQTMRLMGCRSLWDMKMAALFGVAVSLPIMIICACLGIFGRALPEFQGLTGQGEADTLYPALVKTYLGVGFKGLVVAGVVAAAVSTFDSMGSALSAIFTRDIYARLLVRGKADEHYVLVGRVATVGVLMLGFLYLPLIAYQENMLNAFISLIPVSVTPLLVVYVAGVTTRVHRRSGLAALLVGSTYGLLALVPRELSKIDADVRLNWIPWWLLDWIPWWLTDQWPAVAWSLSITVLTLVACSAVFGLEPRGKVKAFKETGWLQRSREKLPALRDHPFPGKRAPALLRPEWYAVALMIATSYVVLVLFW